MVGAGKQNSNSGQVNFLKSCELWMTPLPDQLELASIFQSGYMVITNHHNIEVGWEDATLKTQIKLPFKDSNWTPVFSSALSPNLLNLQ